MRKALISAAAAAIALAGLVDAPAGARLPARDPSRPSAARIAAYTPPPIEWGRCTKANAGSDDAAFLRRHGARCGFVVVPMDYADPAGPTIQLAISRVLHKTKLRSKYRGVMLVNPGGPGGSGQYLSILQTFVPERAGLGYDWIGWDPRGVGNSIPSLSCDPSYLGGARPPYRPIDAAIESAWVRRSQRYAAACTRADGAELFRHVRTVDTIADMESIRRALGTPKISFYGFSYGTYLATVYMTLHPHRVGRFVLDSTVDPRKVFYQSNLNQDVAFQKTFDVYFRWLARYHRVYHVGATRDAVRNRFLNVETRLNATPADGFLGGDELLDVFTDAGYYIYDWITIARAWSTFLHDGKAGPLIRLYKGANPTTPGGDNSYVMYLATQCTDAEWPRSQAVLDADSWRLDQTYNYFTWSNAWFNGPCAYWHYPHSQPVDVHGADVRAPVLMIDETFDPATPFSGSLYVRSIFPTASLIEGRNGTTHAGSLSGVACTDNAIADYLLTGQVPRRRSGNRSDRVCPPVPKPVPGGSGVAATSDRSGLRARLAASVSADGGRLG